MQNDWTMNIKQNEMSDKMAASQPFFFWSFFLTIWEILHDS